MRNEVIKNITDKADELVRSEFQASLQEEEYNKILYGSGYH